ncbi:unnamed protein product [Trichobilharzia szidati]|nr:unnamed protein product [Trichobilharzia szidati]CAH8874477.1 unnamed protein product [Trichobilharzia szidati]
METLMAPTASTSSPQMPMATSSPITQPIRQTTKENTDSNDKVVSELQSLKGEVQLLKEKMQSFGKLLTQLVSSNRSGDVTILGTGKSSIDNSQLEFPLSTEEEFNQLEASLKSPKFRDSFMTKLVGNLSFNPQSSLRRMLNYIREP